MSINNSNDREDGVSRQHRKRRAELSRRAADHSANRQIASQINLMFGRNQLSKLSGLAEFSFKKLSELKQSYKSKKMKNTEQSKHKKKKNGEKSGVAACGKTDDLRLTVTASATASKRRRRNLCFAGTITAALFLAMLAAIVPIHFNVRTQRSESVSSAKTDLTINHLTIILSLPTEGEQVNFSITATDQEAGVRSAICGVLRQSNDGGPASDVRPSAITFAITVSGQSLTLNGAFSLPAFVNDVGAVCEFNRTNSIAILSVKAHFNPAPPFAPCRSPSCFILKDAQAGGMWDLRICWCEFSAR